MGDIFFLVGTLGGSAERECTISEGQDILIPIINRICIDKPGAFGAELATSFHQKSGQVNRQLVAKKTLKTLSTKHQTWRLLSMVCRLKIYKTLEYSLTHLM